MDNRLAVFLFFTDTDGNNVKADGTGRITVTELDFDGNKVGNPYSYEVEFEKDGFQTWRDDSGLKHTAHAFYINQEFASRGLYWDVSMEVTLEDGTYWPDVDTRFISADSPQETMQTIPEPIPSLSPSNLCGSEPITVNLFCGISLQSKSGGGEGIQKSGYDGSQLSSIIFTEQPVQASFENSLTSQNSVDTVPNPSSTTAWFRDIPLQVILATILP